MIRILQYEQSNINAICEFCAGKGTDKSLRDARRLRKYFLQKHLGCEEFEELGDEPPRYHRKPTGYLVFSAIDDSVTSSIKLSDGGIIPIEELPTISGNPVIGQIEGSDVEVTSEPIIGENFWVLRCIRILEPYRRKGIGERMVRRFINAARNYGSGVAVLADVADGPNLSKPQGLFKKFGFEIVDVQGDNALMYLSTQGGEKPGFLMPVTSEIGKADIELFWSESCPAMVWSATDIKKRISKYPEITFRDYKIRDRHKVEELHLNEETGRYTKTNDVEIDDVGRYGMGNGLIVRGKVIHQRLVFWDDIVEQLSKLGVEIQDE